MMPLSIKNSFVSSRKNKYLHFLVTMKIRPIILKYAKHQQISEKKLVQLELNHLSFYGVVTALCDQFWMIKHPSCLAVAGRLKNVSSDHNLATATASRAQTEAY